MSLVRSTPRCLKIIFACCALATTCYGQAINSVTSGVTTTLNEVTCKGTKCWAVGDGGVIINSADGGTTWSTQTSGTTNDLEAVSFFSETQGTVVGTAGTILDTSDGGTTWTTQTSGVSSDTATGGMIRGVISTVSRVSATHAFATYYDDSQSKNRLLSTTNGGTWTNSSPTGDTSGGSTIESSFAKDISFIDATQGWGCNDGGYITKTTDAGATWITHDTSTSKDLKDIFFFDANNGYVVGSDGHIERTTDGGSTWAQVGTSLTVNKKLYGVAFASATAGCAVGKESTIVCTTNGNVWTQVANPFATSIKLRSIAFSSTSAVAVGNSGSVAVGECTGLGLCPTSSGNTATSAAISVFLGVVCTLLNLMLC